MGFGVWVLGFEVWGLGFGLLGLLRQSRLGLTPRRTRASDPAARDRRWAPRDLRVRVQGSGCRVRVLKLGCRVQDVGSGVNGIRVETYFLGFGWGFGVTLGFGVWEFKVFGVTCLLQ